MPRLTQQQLGLAVLHILAAQPDGEASLETLRAELPKHLSLSAEDREGNATKDDDIWKQQLSRLKASDATPGNIFRDYHVITATSGGWRITPNGLRHINAPT
jgi:hypothetical protein